MFGLNTMDGVSVFDAIAVPDSLHVPELYDGNQELAGRRILVLMQNGWGDTILIQPALRALYEKGDFLGDSPRMTVGCNWVCNFPYPDAVFVHDVRPNIMTLGELGEFDLLVNLVPVNHQRSQRKSMRDLCFEQMMLNGENGVAAAPVIVPDAGRAAKLRPELERIRAASTGRLLCINWKSRFPHKDAPAALFFDVVDRLSGTYQAVLLKDAEAAEAMQQEIDEAGCPVMNLSHMIDDYHDTIAALSQVDAFVSVDTGIVHAAGALGIPGVGVFGPFPPETHIADYASVAGVRASYEGRGCRGPCLETHRGCAETNFAPEKVSPCFRALTPESVITAFERAVGPREKGRR